MNINSRSIAARTLAHAMESLPAAWLRLIAAGDVDLAQLARAELANRGLDALGRWVGEQTARVLQMERR